VAVLVTAPKGSFQTDYGRFYRHPKLSKTVPSVTNIKKQKNNPAINGAAVRKVAEYAVDNRDRLKDLTRPEQVQLIKAAQYASADKDASRIGDIVHAWVDGYCKHQQHPWERPAIQLGFDNELIEYSSAPLTARRMYRQFSGDGKEGFLPRYNPSFVDSEFTVWSHQFGYAGTADWAAYIRGMLVLGDTKTGKGAWPDTGLQLAALAFADVMLDDEGNEIPMPKFERCAILHLRPTSYELIPVDHLEACFQAFLGLKANFDWDVEHADHVLLATPKFNADYKGV
jgi:hypothetical protein